MKLTTILGLLISAGIFNINISQATEKNYKAVFENNSSDAKSWESMLNNVENTSKALPNVEIEVVSHGDGLDLLMKSNEKMAQRMKKIDLSGVRFMACENTMQKKKVTKEDLLSFSHPIDSGVAEVIRKQQEGWSYVKSGQ